MWKALEHDSSTLKLSCQNQMSVSERNLHDCIHIPQDISMISMNVKKAYSDWYDTVSDEEIDNVCIYKKWMKG